MVDSYRQLAKKLKAVALGGSAGEDSVRQIPHLFKKCRKLEHLFIDTSSLDLDLTLPSLRSIKPLRFGAHSPVSLLVFAMLFTNPESPLRDLQRLVVRADSPFAALNGNGAEAVAARDWWKQVGWEASQLQVVVLPALSGTGAGRRSAEEKLTLWRPLD